MGWKRTPARRPLAGKNYVGPVELLSWLVKFHITAIQIMRFGSRLCDLGVVGPVETKLASLLFIFATCESLIAT